MGRELRGVFQAKKLGSCVQYSLWLHRGAVLELQIDSVSRKLASCSLGNNGWQSCHCNQFSFWGTKILTALLVEDLGLLYELEAMAVKASQKQEAMLRAEGAQRPSREYKESRSTYHGECLSSQWTF